ncbi:hypothetical protein NARC_150106 [Candidatus Nitrosocosmicus arcticus]|uniref:Uncharacterized protein n=1 Tax=Candidatus Nitrosocosmicus arcticus TaxID=2035267 RepID=A0A557SSE2_9ARCH|nr:hypothetical protein NARC_150106 [Candidatus Nitrosocosmicus arcticus]
MGEHPLDKLPNGYTQCMIYTMHVPHSSEIYKNYLIAELYPFNT